MRVRFAVCVLAAVSCSFLTGCGAGRSSGATAVLSPVSPVAAVVKGRTMGGQQPVSGAAIQLYAVGTTGDGSASTALLSPPAVTDANGNFTVTTPYTCPVAPGLVYLLATGGDPGLGSTNPAIALMTALGPCASLNANTFVMVDERTTVAAVAALAPFMRSSTAIGASSVDASALATAFTLAQAYASPSSGAVPGPTLPANATAPVSTINSLADIVAACINSNGDSNSPCGSLFANTRPTSASAPADTVAAVLNIMRDPQTNAAALFGLIYASAPFQPQLTGAPADWTIALSGSGAPTPVPNGCSSADLSGQNAFTNYTLQQPGVCRRLTAQDLPAPDTNASSTNYSTQVARQPGQVPLVPPGFTVTLYASGLNNPRYILPAANGDLLVSEAGAGNILVLRGVNASGAAVQQTTFASGLASPYGMAFYPSAASPQYLYVGNTASLVRFPYALGDTAASASAATLATDIPDGGNHTTRGLLFTNETTPRLLVSVGSADNYANTDTTNADYHRANVLAYSVAGTFQSIYASGLRNPVSLAMDSMGRVWTSVNERDGLGDNVPADYVTHVQEAGFYGWPWYYNGPNPEPRLPNSHPELASQTIVADVLLQPHFAPLQINFYTGTQFPTPYRENLFVSSHGSWNKAVRGGYEVVRVRMSNGSATGENEDFMTGFVNADGTVWGRPAGVAMGADGALYVTDDASNTIWRVTYTGH